MSATKTEAEAVKIEPQQAGQPAGSPRKRRRRAPTTGAADDCFACQERQTKCDRRRPYCTPCLDQGKDCSGYKTQLTWGVGVASRGKLRGLSLPIPKSKRAAQSMDEEDVKKTDGPKKLAKLGPIRRASDSVHGPHERSPHWETRAPLPHTTLSAWILARQPAQPHRRRCSPRRISNTAPRPLSSKAAMRSRLAKDRGDIPYSPSRSLQYILQETMESCR